MQYQWEPRDVVVSGVHPTDFKTMCRLLNKLPEQEQAKLTGKHELARENWEEMSRFPGREDDCFQEKIVYATGIERRIVLSTVRLGQQEMNMSTIEVRPVFVEEVKWKSSADQIKALDVLRGRMLGALSFLGYSEAAAKR